MTGSQSSKTDETKSAEPASSGRQPAAQEPKEGPILIMALGTLFLAFVMACVSVVVLLAILYPPPMPKPNAGPAAESSEPSSETPSSETPASEAGSETQSSGASSSNPEPQ